MLPEQLERISESEEPVQSRMQEPMAIPVLFEGQSNRSVGGPC